MSEAKGATALPVPVAAVDNDRMALLAIKGILPQLLPGAQWMWGAAAAQEAIAKALDPDTRPRLLMVDMSLGESTGVSVCRKIRARTSRVRLLAITAFATNTYAEQVAEAGAQGIASKADVPQLAQALRAVASGGVFNPDPTRPATFLTAERAHERLTHGPSAGRSDSADAGSFDDAREAAAPKLGAKEAETLHLLSRGMSYEQIAAQWGVATSTVRTHAHRAVDKLGANSLAHAIAIWLESGR
ncbi:two component transcriptional regulator, LuxR family [Bifidobacterium lemurum]|uniref:Two component transcriptional regulator, LuxR family n=1 Tax=Bifidobacterium lemurum TaxID=1603886 RepID=A0A261FS92_9BIFI|nr:response regulator transcription factor [Bifidobacterium lemurum]OZG62017.1 two component transcriptional regulator, LuxR family [Bifidobacterium lemurum]QOL34850.1 response regulator transcription factor [Bifidobacterium lemurum]